MTRADVVVGRTSGYGTIWSGDGARTGHFGARQWAKVDLCPECYDAEMERRRQSWIVLWWALGVGGALVVAVMLSVALVLISRS